MNGKCWFIVGAPIVKGKDLFADELKKRKEWKTEQMRLIDPYFNQALARKHNYPVQGIDHIDLRLYKLIKKNT